MILGMISFSLFLFEQGFKGMHIYHFHEIIEIVEFSHLILFFSMITYYLFVVLLGIVCNRHLSFLEKFEQNLKGRGENVWTLAKGEPCGSRDTSHYKTLTHLRLPQKMI